MSTFHSRRTFLKLAAGSFAAMTVAACGGAATPAATTPAQQSGTPTLDIGSKGDELLFDKSSLEVPAGSKVTLRFKNNATVAATLHNWVLTQPGQADAVAAEGIAAGEPNGYVKPGDTRVIAKTKMIKGGETDSITFDAPKPGTYPFICTFPGHNALMKGTLVVK